MTCPDPLNAVSLSSVSYPVGVTASLQWSSTANKGVLEVEVFENSPPVTPITIQFKDSNGWLWRNSLTSPLMLCSGMLFSGLVWV